MKKDVILALVAGLIIGSTIAILAVKLPVVLTKKAGEEDEKAEVKLAPTVIRELNSPSLSINNPPDLAILYDNNITLQGNTKPASIIIVESPSASLILEPDKNGSFSTQLKLTEGGNPLYITAVKENGDSETKTHTLFFTNEKL